MSTTIQKTVVYGLTSPLVFKLIDAINWPAPTIQLEGIVLSDGDNPQVNTYGYPILGDASIIPTLGTRLDLAFFCNINRSPREMFEADAWLARNGCRPINLIHPGIDLNMAHVGTNVFLAEGCLVGPGSVLGSHVTCRMGGIISHEVCIEDRVYLGPGVRICGRACLQEGCDIGAGVTVLPGVTIGRNTIVGAGAVVTQDLPDNVTAVGMPAKVIKQHAPDDDRFILADQ